MTYRLQKLCVMLRNCPNTFLRHTRIRDNAGNSMRLRGWSGTGDSGATSGKGVLHPALFWLAVICFLAFHPGRTEAQFFPNRTEAQPADVVERLRALNTEAKKAYNRGAYAEGIAAAE